MAKLDYLKDDTSNISKYTGTLMVKSTPKTSETGLPHPQPETAGIKCSDPPGMVVWNFEVMIDCISSPFYSPSMNLTKGRTSELALKFLTNSLNRKETHRSSNSALRLELPFFVEKWYDYASREAAHHAVRISYLHCRRVFKGA